MVTTVLIWLLVAFLAYLIKGFSGFGPALLVIPALSVLYNPPFAVTVSALIELGVGVILVATWRPEHGDWKILTKLSGYVAVGAIIGSLSVGAIPQDILLTLIGGLVIFLGYRLWQQGTPTITNSRGTSAHRWATPALSLMAGISGGLVGISGPFLVAATSHYNKTHMRRILVAVFVVEDTVRTLIYGGSGFLTREALTVALIAVPGVIGGLLVGSWLHHRVTQVTFLRALSGFVLTAGVITLLRLAL